MTNEPDALQSELNANTVIWNLECQSQKQNQGKKITILLNCSHLTESLFEFWYTYNDNFLWISSILYSYATGK